MKRFIWNWRFKFSLFNKKEKVLFPFLVGFMFVSLISIPSLFKVEYYDVTFYDANQNIIFKEVHREEDELNLSDISPEQDESLFYAWSLASDEHIFKDKITVESDLSVYGVWGRIEEITEEETLAFSSVKNDDSSIIKGEEVVKKEGQEGLKQSKYQVFYVGDKVIKKDLIKKEVVKEPEDKIIHVGTKEKTIAQVPKEDKGASSNNNQVLGFVSSSVPEKKAEVKSKPEPQAKPVTPAEPKQEPITPKKPESNYTPVFDIQIIPNAYNDKFKNCDQLREVYPLGVPKGHPAYENYRSGDRDKDGWACEVKGTPGGYFEN